MSLEISPEIENAVRERASVEGVSVEELLARAFAPEIPKTPPVTDPKARLFALLAQWQAQDKTPLRPPPPTRPGETPTQALFRQWAEEDATMTEEECEVENRLWEDIENSLLQEGRSLHLKGTG